jgi:hypothetical protein
MKLFERLKDLKRRKITSVTLFYIAPSLILLVVMVYGAWYANLSNTVNSDHIIYPLLFKDVTRYDLVALANHANFLKFPLYFFQSLIPYNIYTASIVNIGLFIVTIGSWAMLLVYVFGKRYLTAIFLTTSAVILGAILLDYELLGPAIRNVEYPIAFAFIVSVAKFASTKSLSKAWRGILIGSTLIYAVSVAGDSLLLYALTVPLVISLLFFTYRSSKGTQKRRRLMLALAITIGSTLLSYVIRWFVQVTGITLLYKDPTNKLYSLPFDHLFPSISLSIEQLLGLFGANIFGQPIGPGLALPFVNFSLLIAGLIGLVLIVRNAYINPQNKKYFRASNQALILTTLVLAFCTTTFAYIFLDLVVSVDATGKFVTAGQDRYLTLLPLIVLTGLAYLFTQYPKKIYNKIVYGAIIIGMSLSFVSLHHARESAYTSYGVSMRWTLNQLSSILKQNKVDLLVAGYWYAAPVSFYSQGTKFVSITNCNQPAPDFNIRKSFYKPDNSVHTSALIIDKQGMDGRFWNCSDGQLTAIYGSPIKKVVVGGPDGTSLDVLIYNYDVRNKISSP